MSRVLLTADLLFMRAARHVSAHSRSRRTVHGVVSRFTSARHGSHSAVTVDATAASWRGGGEADARNELQLPSMDDATETEQCTRLYAAGVPVRARPASLPRASPPPPAFTFARCSGCCGAERSRHHNQIKSTQPNQAIHPTPLSCFSGAFPPPGSPFLTITTSASPRHTVVIPRAWRARSACSGLAGALL